MIHSNSSPNSTSSASSYAESELLEHFFTRSWEEPQGPTTLRLGGYGKDIDWTLVVSSITRPVWEPPALEVLDVFETAFWEDREKEWAEAVPNRAIRTELLELNMLIFAIGRYAVWAKQTGGNAIEVADVERERFYEGLLQELLLEFSEVMTKLYVLLKEHVPESSAALPKAEQSIFEDERAEYEGFWEDVIRSTFTLRPVDKCIRASSPTAQTEYASEAISQRSDWSIDIAGLPELFTDWIDNVFNLDILFDEAELLSAATTELPPNSADNQVVRLREGFHMCVNLGVLASRGSASLPPFSLHTFNQNTASTLMTQPERPAEPLYSPRTSNLNEDLIDLESLVIPSSSTPEARALDNRTDLSTPITNKQCPSRSR